MRYEDKRHGMKLALDAKGFTIPHGRVRMQTWIEGIMGELKGVAPARLEFRMVFHDKSSRYHVEEKLKLSGQTLFTGDWDTYLDSAFRRSARKFMRKAERYRDQGPAAITPSPPAAGVHGAPAGEFIAPEDPEAGQVAAAVRTDDYLAFRKLLSGYETWLRNRVGRWVQRYPDVEAGIGQDYSIDDLVEEVFLTAFERYHKRPTGPPLGQWLDDLIDAALRHFFREEEEPEKIRLAKTWVESAGGNSPDGRSNSVSSRRQTCLRDSGRPTLVPCSSALAGPAL